MANEGQQLQIGLILLFLYHFINLFFKNKKSPAPPAIQKKKNKKTKTKTSLGIDGREKRGTAPFKTS